ncbi:MAG: hypothetical protein U5J63_09810 [Fodinibius sp.]|nr:hypothetical protein [Fodinibius sp.]
MFAVTQTNGQSPESPERFLKWAVNDPVAMVSDVSPHLLLTTATFGAGVAIISPGDASTSRNFQAGY